MTGILNEDLAGGLDLGSEEDRAIYRTRVARRYERMRKHALVKEATDYGQGSYVHLSHGELVRKIADRSINYMLADADEGGPAHSTGTSPGIVK